MHPIILQSYNNRSSFGRHTLVMFHYILVSPSSIRGKSKRSLHNLPKENNGFKLNFIQESSRKKSCKESLSWKHIFIRSWFYNHTLIVLHCSLVCPSSTMESQKMFWMSLHKKIFKSKTQSKLWKAWYLIKKIITKRVIMEKHFISLESRTISWYFLILFRFHHHLKNNQRIICTFLWKKIVIWSQNSI
jgi:hypothetical protein